jgi:dUTP pyrophosphatase
LKERFIMIKFKKLNENAIIPCKGKIGDAGFDLFTLNDTIIQPHQTIVIPTGISVQLETNQEATIRPRSGITLKGCGGCYGCAPIFRHEIFDSTYKECSPYLRVQLGTLDSNYRGDIGIIVYNQEDYEVDIPAKTKLAQMVIGYISTDEVIVVDELDESERNEKGFGSSGVK